MYAEGKVRCQCKLFTEIIQHMFQTQRKRKVLLQASETVQLVAEPSLQSGYRTATVNEDLPKMDSVSGYIFGSCGRVSEVKE